MCKQNSMLLKTNLNTDTYLVVGLGNPGKKYKHSRHNIGFMVVDKIAQEFDVPLTKVKQKSLISLTRVDQKQLVLIKPQTFMNASGNSVAALFRFYKIPLENLIVIHDDLDIPFGKLRIRPSGGTSGQKGMKSIIEKIGSQDFPRVRVGIGRPPGRMDPSDYVLYNFLAEEIPLLEETIDKAVKSVKTIVLEGLNQAMNLYNA